VVLRRPTGVFQADRYSTSRPKILAARARLARVTRLDRASSRERVSVIPVACVLRWRRLIWRLRPVKALRLVGRSGAGKIHTGQSVAAFLSMSSSGYILLDGHDVRRFHALERSAASVRDGQPGSHAVQRHVWRRNIAYGSLGVKPRREQIRTGRARRPCDGVHRTHCRKGWILWSGQNGGAAFRRAAPASWRLRGRCSRTRPS
jgi:hypothetical protein